MVQVLSLDEVRHRDAPDLAGETGNRAPLRGGIVRVALPAVVPAAAPQAEIRRIFVAGPRIVRLAPPVHVHHVLDDVFVGASTHPARIAGDRDLVRSAARHEGTRNLTGYVNRVARDLQTDSVVVRVGVARALSADAGSAQLRREPGEPARDIVHVRIFGAVAAFPVVVDLECLHRRRGAGDVAVRGGPVAGLDRTAFDRRAIGGFVQVPQSSVDGHVGFDVERLGLHEHVERVAPLCAVEHRDLESRRVRRPGNPRIGVFELQRERVADVDRRRTRAVARIPGCRDDVGRRVVGVDRDALEHQLAAVEHLMRLRRNAEPRHGDRDGDARVADAVRVRRRLRRVVRQRTVVQRVWNAVVVHVGIARVADTIMIAIFLIRVEDVRAVIAAVRHAVVVDIGIARVAQAVVIQIGLVGIEDGRTVVACVRHAIAVFVVVARVADPVVVDVGLVGVRNQRTVVVDVEHAVVVGILAGVADAVVVDVGLVRIRDVRTVV